MKELVQQKSTVVKQKKEQNLLPLFNSNSGYDGSRKRAASNSPQADPPNKKRIRVQKTTKKTDMKESSRGGNKRGAGRGRRGGYSGRGSKRMNFCLVSNDK